MASPSLSPATRAHARRALAVWTGAVALYVGLALAAYFTLPAASLDIEEIWVAVALVVSALALLVWLLLVQIRRIPKADAPIVRSLSLLVLVLVPVLLMFSYLYLSLAARGDRQMEGVETHLDALYFTVTMITTVGFGDITPSGQLARGVATVQMVFNVVVLGFLVRTVLQVGRESSRRRHRAGSPSTSGGGLGERSEQWQASPDTDTRAEGDEP